MIEDRKNSMQSQNIVQNLILENREKLTITGVIDVLSFDDQIVIIETELGLLTIKGEDLRINKLSIDSSEVMIEGKIFNLGYSENAVSGKGGNSLFSKIFKWNWKGFRMLWEMTYFCNLQTQEYICYVVGQ